MLSGGLSGVEWTDGLGLFGVLMIVAAYLALQLELTDSRSLAYSAANAVGAALVIVSLYFDFNLSAFVIEFFWLLISLLGIARGLRRRRTGPIG